MPFECNVATAITDRMPAGTGWRWVWTPGKGAFAIDPSFSKALAVNYTPVTFVTVAPDGNAFIGQDRSIQFWSPAGKEVWLNDNFGADGDIIGEPFVRPDHKSFVVPLLGTFGTGTVYLKVSVLNYADGTATQTYDIEQLATGQEIQVAFDVTGTVLYLSTQGTAAANVRACVIGKTSLCRPGTDAWLWTTNDLQGALTALVPYNNGTRLAAISTNRIWMLDVKNAQPGSVPLVNKDQQPFATSGSLVSRFVQPGLGNSSVFYMFNSAAPTGTNLLPYPVELIATDAAEKGELYRYQVTGGSVYGTLDDAGTLWLRIGPRLVKPFAPAWYRERR
jgi:hypothetical protein